MIVVSLALLLAVEPRFDVAKLNVFGEVEAVTPADFDGDGLLDLLVVHRRGTIRAQKRTMAIFWNNRGGFSAKPDVTFPVPEDACAYDVADVDEHKGAELLWVSHDGVSATLFRDRDRRSTAVLTHDPTLFLHADRDGLMRLPIAQAVSGQGVELLVPVTDVLAVYRRSASGWFSVARLDTSLAKIDLKKDWREIDDHYLGSFHVDIDFPAVHVADANGDGLKDLVFSDQDRIAIFHQAPGLGFSREPSFSRDFQIATEQEMDEGFTQATSLVRDLDGDGLVDLVLTKQVSQGITSGSSTTYLFMGQPGGGYSQKAEQTIVSDGVGGTVSQLVDLTADGKPELLLPSVKMGVLAIIRALTTQTVKVVVAVHAFEARKRFSEKAAAERELTFKFSLSGKSDLQAIDVRGDYNGDGKRDMAFGTTGGELALYMGTGQGPLIAEDALEKVKVNARGRLQPIDLDNDKKDEIVLFYPNSRDERGQVVVLFNKGPW